MRLNISPLLSSRGKPGGHTPNPRYTAVKPYGWCPEAWTRVLWWCNAMLTTCLRWSLWSHTQDHVMCNTKKIHLLKLRWVLTALRVGQFEQTQNCGYLPYYEVLTCNDKNFERLFYYNLYWYLRSLTATTWNDCCKGRLESQVRQQVV